MNRNELSDLIRQLEEKYARDRLKRFIWTVLFYTAVFVVICYWQGFFENATFLSADWFLAFGDALLGGAFLSILSVFFNSIIFHQLYEQSASENRHIEGLKKKLNEMEKYK